jgi:hypothetical protein
MRSHQLLRVGNYPLIFQLFLLNFNILKGFRIVLRFIAEEFEFNL